MVLWAKSAATTKVSCPTWQRPANQEVTIPFHPFCAQCSTPAVCISPPSITTNNNDNVDAIVDVYVDVGVGVGSDIDADVGIGDDVDARVGVCIGDGDGIAGAVDVVGGGAGGGDDVVGCCQLS